MASILELKKKVNGIKNTKKITKAMQLVAASKMQKFQKKALSTREYVMQLLIMLEQNIANDSGSIYAEKRTEGKTLFVIYTSDKGLCGALNTKLIKSLFRSKKWLETPEEERLLITIGKKCTEYTKNNSIKTEKTFVGLPEQMTNLDALKVIDQILEFWTNKECKEIIFFTPHYENSFTNYPVMKQFLPFSEDMLYKHLGKDKVEDTVGSTKLRNNFMLFNPSEEEVSERLHQLIVQSLFVQAFLELKAAEYSSRMIAMKNATDAADTIIEDLTLTMNKARQTAITQEIAELVGAKAAME